MLKQTCLKLALPGLALPGLVMLGVLSAADAPAVFTGVITDTLCGKTHAMMHASSDEACVRTCAKASGEYALYDGKDVFKLSDQKTPAKFAAQRVKVTGTYDEKARRIKVITMELAKE
jgi:hypothetical protein